jgi:hydrogenase small subunit
MSRYTRRDFLRAGAALAAGLGLGAGRTRVLADGLEALLHGSVKVLWLQGMSCSGCSVSLLDADQPGPLEIVTDILSLVYHPNLSAAQGAVAMELIDQLTSAGQFVLVFEGAISSKLPESCTIGGRSLAELLPPVIRASQAVIAAGTCASFGGIPAAEGNPTAAVGLKPFMESQGLAVADRLINLPGCPVHWEALLSTVACLAAGKPLALDPVLLTPELAYKHSVHDDCPRFHYWEKRVFAEKFGDEGCLFNLGCLGPLSHANCSRHQWNGGVNWCIRAGAPCTACSSADFARRRDFPFYRKSEPSRTIARDEIAAQGARS